MRIMNLFKDTNRVAPVLRTELATNSKGIKRASFFELLTGRAVRIKTQSAVFFDDLGTKIWKPKTSTEWVNKASLNKYYDSKNVSSVANRFTAKISAFFKKNVTDRFFVSAENKVSLKADVENNVTEDTHKNKNPGKVSKFLRLFDVDTDKLPFGL